MKAKKILSLLLVSTMVTGMVFGCGSSESGSGGSGEVDDEGNWTGKITMWAKEYTPSEDTGLTKLQEYADAYAEEHPGVEIEFVELPGDTVVNEYIRTQAAAQELPDITFLNYIEIGNAIPKDMFTPLTEYFNQEDPYVEGQTWGETFNDAVMQMIQIGSGEYYSVCADYVETGIYYNKDMFDAAGITDLPTNWEEFVDACKKLKDAGFTPLAWSMAQDDTYSTSWTNRVFLSNAYADIMDEIDVDGVAGVSTMEKAVAYKNGTVNASDGKFLSYFEPLKELVPYMNDSWASKTDLEQKFMNEEVAMYWTGSWLPMKIEDAGVDINYGSFPFPTPTSNTVPGVTTDTVTSGAVGGPSGSFQYSVSSEAANKTMSPEKLEVVIDWLMYITAPERVTEIVNEYGSFCPVVDGATPLEGMDGLLDNLNADYVNFDGGQSISGVMADTTFRYLHQYMLGEVTLEECEEALDQTMSEEVDTAIADNPDWDIDQYLNE